MTLAPLNELLTRSLADLEQSGRRKGPEREITRIVPATGNHGPRYCLAGQGGRQFLRMNANSYLGLSLHPMVIAAAENAARHFGTGPGAVRFISGTYQVHRELEQDLARFHARPAGMIFSSAYTAVLGVLAALITKETIVLSDSLNHNCIINGLRLAQPTAKKIYPHLDLTTLENNLQQCVGAAQRLLVVTDGIFSMRGDHAPLADLVALCESYQHHFPEGIITVADDSHGIGAIGATGRGVEEYCGARVDILIATLGKALGVNGGYVVSTEAVINYLRESAPLYIYSNPISPAEAAAAGEALRILDSTEGMALLEKLRHLTKRFQVGVQQRGWEMIPGDHPIVPLLIRDTARTTALISFLFDHNILATGLNYPVVPRGDEEIRFQICANHTEADLDYCLSILDKFLS